MPSRLDGWMEGTSITYTHTHTLRVQNYHSLNMNTWDPLSMNNNFLFSKSLMLRCDDFKEEETQALTVCFKATTYSDPAVRLKAPRLRSLCQFRRSYPSGWCVFLLKDSTKIRPFLHPWVLRSRYICWNPAGSVYPSQTRFWLIQNLKNDPVVAKMRWPNPNFAQHQRSG